MPTWFRTDALHGYAVRARCMHARLPGARGRRVTAARTAAARRGRRLVRRVRRLVRRQYEGLRAWAPRG
eukprot:COSAG06_NODE_28934_length_565_cov_0.984979_1_plen_68_part_01